MSPFYLSIGFFSCLSLSPSPRECVCISFFAVHLHPKMSICLSVYISVCLSVYLYVCLFICCEPLCAVCQKTSHAREKTALLIIRSVLHLHCCCCCCCLTTCASVSGDRHLRIALRLPTGTRFLGFDRLTSTDLSSIEIDVYNKTVIATTTLLLFSHSYLQHLVI